MRHPPVSPRSPCFVWPRPLTAIACISPRCLGSDRCACHVSPPATTQSHTAALITHIAGPGKRISPLERKICFVGSHSNIVVRVSVGGRDIRRADLSSSRKRASPQDRREGRRVSAWRALQRCAAAASEGGAKWGARPSRCSGQEPLTRPRYGCARCRARTRPFRRRRGPGSVGRVRRRRRAAARAACCPARRPAPRAFRSRARAGPR